MSDKEGRAGQLATGGPARSFHAPKQDVEKEPVNRDFTRRAVPPGLAEGTQRRCRQGRASYRHACPAQQDRDVMLAWLVAGLARAVRALIAGMTPPRHPPPPPTPHAPTNGQVAGQRRFRVPV